MLVNLDFLQNGAPWPPKNYEERERLRRYQDNRALFEGKHELVFHEVFERLFRRDPNMKMSVEMVLNWPKRLSTLWMDLLVGERPDVNEASDNDYVYDLISRLDLWRSVSMAALDLSRYGNAVFKVRRDDSGAVKVAVIPPAFWFPVVSETDAKQTDVQCLAWPTGDPEAGTGQLHVELHMPGKLETRIYQRGNKMHNFGVYGSIGRLIEQREEKNGVDGCLVIPVANTETSDSIYGCDDYSDLASIIQELEVRFAQIARILDKHADPKMYGPDDTYVDEKTGQRVANLGDYIPLNNGDTPPGYIVWNSQTESSFRQIEMLMQQFYILSETSPAVFGDIKSGLAESGSALQRLLAAPLAKVNRVRMSLDTAVREVIRVAALLDKNKKVTPVIVWKDGLPDDETEQIQNEATAISAGISSKRAAMQRVYGYSEEQADDELKRISAEEPQLADPSTFGTPQHDDE